MKKKEKTRKFKAKKNYQQYVTNDHQVSVFVQLHLIHKELLAVWKHRLLTRRLCTHEFSEVQSLSRIWLFATPWTAAHQASLSITNSRSLLKLMSIKSVMLANFLILCHPLLLLSSIFPSIRVFTNESALPIRSKYWSFSFDISPSMNIQN